MKPRGQLTPEQAVKVDILKLSLPNFAVMRGLAMRFRGILRGHDPSKLDSWLNDARSTGLRGKTLKRSMYGRAGTELLRARMLPLRL
jgi:hypothetical protein